MATPKVRSGSSGSGPGTLRCPACNAVYAPPLENCPSCGAELPQLESVVRPGSVIDEKYEVISLLGAGGMGEVYKARHVHLNAIRTIKVLKPGLLADSWFRNRFLREARLATQLSHPNLAVMHDFSVLPNGSCYMVSEFVDGLTVRQWIKRFGRFPLGLAVEIVSQVLSGLGYCHRRGLLHRDISPDNIMITVDSDDQPVVKIIDLGIAKQLGGRPADATQTGLFVGNPKYCSPEQLGHLDEGQELDGRADIYSLGVVLYEMVTGAAPFRSNTPHGYLIKHLTQAPPDFDETDPGLSIPKEFQRVTFKALEKERSRRYSSAEELAGVLRPFRTDVSRGLEATFGITLREVGTARGSQSDEGRSTEKIASHPPARPSAETEVAPDYVRNKEVRREEEEKARKEEEGRREESRALNLVRELEGRHDLSGLEALAASWPVDAKVAREASGAIGRVRVLAAREKRETEAKNWEHAWKDGSESAWQEFLDRHADSPRHSEAARLQAEARDLQKALGSQSQDEWQEFLRAWPDSRFREQVGQKIEQARSAEAAELDRAQELGTAQAFREFLERHPRSFLASMAQTFLEEQTAFDAARAADTIQGWEQFLERWPSGRNSASAIARCRLAEEREEKALAEALQAGTSASLRKFLERHPAAKNRARAETLLQEAVDWEKSRREGRAGLERFLKSFPDGPHADAARVELRRLEEESLLKKVAQLEKAGDFGELDRIARSQPSPSAVGQAARAAIERLVELDWKKASKENGEAGWEHFLRDHATSPRAEEARRRLLELRAAREEKTRAEQQAAREREAKRQAELRAQRERQEKQQAELRAEREREREQKREAELRAQREREEKTQILARKATPAFEPDVEKTERLSLSAVPEPPPVVSTAQPPRTEAAPARAASATEIPAVTLPSKRPARVAALTVTAAVGLAAIGWFVLSRGRTAQKAGDTADLGAQATPAVVATARPAPSAETGLLVVDVLPWGRVERIEDGGGKNWLPDGQSYTPLAVTIPRGRYSVIVTSANFPGKKLTLAAEVGPGETATCQGRFEVLEAKAYFEAEGWR
jgi:serine/threonine protein kinase